ncbi:MAG TPA: adenylate/guanylate cyclase domain-containing protein [Burkholderiales bacterium]|nr:adenylate/guanylate cyclase domain-containing protein [Burkholderiales bacterium]
MTAVPETRYAKSGDVHIAYQVLGDGPIDLLFVPGFVSNVEATWQHPVRAAFFRRLASFSRLILFDKRGTGMSDRTSQVFTLEQRMEDVNAVLDAVGSKRAALFGTSEGGPMSILFAASHPQRTIALVIFGSYAKRSWAEDYTFGWQEERWNAVLSNMERNWGTPKGVDLEMWAPSIAHDAERATKSAAYFRAAASPGAALAVMSMNRDIDVRRVLPSVRVPTLVLHRVDEKVIDVEHARYLARHIPGAKLIELPGVDHIFWVGDGDAIVDEVELFLTGRRQAAEPERVLATVQFTDIVQSTERAAALGDRKWREVLERFQSMVRETLREHRGREIDTAGDGFLAAFDGPARAIRCAAAVRERARAQGIDLRAGIHTGECEIIGDKLGGIAVHTGSRVAGKAEPGEILVSQTVKDLVAGSGLQFADRGMHALRGVPGEWRLYAFAG